VTTQPRETAGWGRRILALFVDWIASTLVVIAVIGTDRWIDDQWAGTYVLGVFLLESALLTATAGGSFGKLVTGLRVVRWDSDPRDQRPPDLLRAVIRQALVCLVIPPVVFRPQDGRGLHDLAAGSATVVRRLPDASPGHR